VKLAKVQAYVSFIT